MPKFLPVLSTALTDFIAAQQLFFVATADVDGRVNVSPKGLDTLRVLAPNRIAWLNLSGSGNETAAHLLATNRMTLMFCSFEGAPLILRVYGTATTVHPGDAAWRELSGLFESYPGARQVFDMQIESVQTSCGYAVPLYDFVGQRSKLLESPRWQSEAETRDYWKTNNTTSIDGKPTGMRVD